MIFHTLKAAGDSYLKEKGSKFLGFSFHASTEEEVTNILQNLRKAYPDATHHCYAYMLGATRSKYRASDDGEPAHSAGDPILGQIKSANLTNVLIVVVRYYGGTKLGVGGLVAAYREAARLSLEGIETEEVHETRLFTIQVSYPQLPLFNRLKDQYDLEVMQSAYVEICTFDVRVKLTYASDFEIALKEFAISYSKAD